jgi:hypothetical protein
VVGFFTTKSTEGTEFIDNPFRPIQRLAPSRRIHSGREIREQVAVDASVRPPKSVVEERCEWRMR